MVIRWDGITLLSRMVLHLLVLRFCPCWYYTCRYYAIAIPVIVSLSVQEILFPNALRSNGVCLLLMPYALMPMVSHSNREIPFGERSVYVSSRAEEKEVGSERDGRDCVSKIRASRVRVCKRQRDVFK